VTEHRRVIVRLAKGSFPADPYVTNPRGLGYLPSNITDGPNGGRTEKANCIPPVHCQRSRRRLTRESYSG